MLQPYCIGEAHLPLAVYGDAIYNPLEVILVRGTDSDYFRQINMIREKKLNIHLDCTRVCGSR